MMLGRAPLLRFIHHQITPHSASMIALRDLKADGIYVDRAEFPEGEDGHADRMFAVEEISATRQAFQKSDGAVYGLIDISALQYEGDDVWVEVSLSERGEDVLEIVRHGGVWTVEAMGLDEAATLEYWRGEIGMIFHSESFTFSEIERLVSKYPQFSILAAEAFHKKLLIWQPAA